MADNEMDKLERLIERGVKLKKAIAMGGLADPSNVDQGGKFKARPALPARSTMKNMGRTIFRKRPGQG